ncbi:hypothetical protein ACFY8O_00945 [Streptomyces argenteolus]|uniref:Syndecan 1 n=1 Tax=Streptomyces argenteolus TaxID=67274 RepID=A0ABW6WZZ9_9ACTN
MGAGPAEGAPSLRTGGRAAGPPPPAGPLGVGTALSAAPGAASFGTGAGPRVPAGAAPPAVSDARAGTTSRPAAEPGPEKPKAPEELDEPDEPEELDESVDGENRDDPSPLAEPVPVPVLVGCRPPADAPGDTPSVAARSCTGGTGAGTGPATAAERWMRGARSGAGALVRGRTAGGTARGSPA